MQTSSLWSLQLFWQRLRLIAFLSKRITWACTHEETPSLTTWITLTDKLRTRHHAARKKATNFHIAPRLTGGEKAQHNVDRIYSLHKPENPQNNETFSGWQIIFPLPGKAENFPGNEKFLHDPMNANVEIHFCGEHIKPLPQNLHFCRDGKEQKFVVSGFYSLKWTTIGSSHFNVALFQKSFCTWSVGSL